MNDRDVIERALRLAVLAVSWAKGSVKVALNTRSLNLHALSKSMQDTAREARELVKAAHRRGHLSDLDRARWLDLIDEAATFGARKAT